MSCVCAGDTGIESIENRVQIVWSFGTHASEVLRSGSWCRQVFLLRLVHREVTSCVEAAWRRNRCGEELGALCETPDNLASCKFSIRIGKILHIPIRGVRDAHHFHPQSFRVDSYLSMPFFFLNPLSFESFLLTLYLNRHSLISVVSFLIVFFNRLFVWITSFVNPLFLIESFLLTLFFNQLFFF